MASHSTKRFALLHRLANEFAERNRLGERPALQEYVDRHPELGDDIRELFPLLVDLESAKHDRDEVARTSTSSLSTPMGRAGRVGRYASIAALGASLAVVLLATVVSLIVAVRFDEPVTTRGACGRGGTNGPGRRRACETARSQSARTSRGDREGRQGDCQDRRGEREDRRSGREGRRGRPHAGD